MTNCYHQICLEIKSRFNLNLSKQIFQSGKCKYFTFDMWHLMTLATALIWAVLLNCTHTPWNCDYSINFFSILICCVRSICWISKNNDGWTWFCCLIQSSSWVIHLDMICTVDRVLRTHLSGSPSGWLWPNSHQGSPLVHEPLGQGTRAAAAGSGAPEGGEWASDGSCAAAGTSWGTCGGSHPASEQTTGERSRKQGHWGYGGVLQAVHWELMCVSLSTAIQFFSDCTVDRFMSILENMTI